jgi:energy-coupling factor transport system ATP-binding protein
VTYLVHELAERGLPVDTQATTAKEAAQTILSALREKNVI